MLASMGQEVENVLRETLLYFTCLVKISKDDNSFEVSFKKRKKKKR